MVGLGFSMLLVGLDFNMVATAVPTITTSFNSLEDVSWYRSSFLIAICICQLLTGNLFANFPHKIIFVMYVAIYLVGSVICGTAQNSATLIVGRAVTGIGASGAKPKQPLYLGLVGGAFTAHASWRWFFWINIPIADITLVTLLLFLNSRTVVDEKRSILPRLKGLDLLVFALFSGTVVQLLLALQLVGFEYVWCSVIIGLVVGFGVTFLAFLLPPNLFKKRTVYLGMLIAFFGNGGFFVILYYLQIWSQAVKGASPLKSGVMYLPTVGTDITGAVLCGALISKAPYYNPFRLFGIGSLIIGAGLDTTFKTNSSAAFQRELAPAKIPLGTTVIIFGQAFSAGLFVAVGQLVFEATLRPFLLQHITSVDAEQVIAAGASGLHEVAGLEVLPLLKEAYNHACTRDFVIAT
ncbi:MFS general substrate transporter [Lentithecium fluviatile CBS 122367]|uniref:MFS general substrate transporter n=1 Tax=Lentithecium fluviatile CBS 122367 TaxID=1168545 RepID=A0A6G1IWZ0_9PLEO|nr:MFS general substrate transporter [Lentithecium fluviatile CBS 122367]